MLRAQSEMGTVKIPSWIFSGHSTSIIADEYKYTAQPGHLTRYTNLSCTDNNKDWTDALFNGVNFILKNSRRTVAISWLWKVTLSYLLHPPGLLIHWRRGCPSQDQKMGLVLELVHLCPSMQCHQILQGVAKEWESLPEEGWQKYSPRSCKMWITVWW